MGVEPSVTGGAAAAPTSWVTPADAWCRACGAEVPSDQAALGVCPTCSWPMEPSGFPETVVGLVYSMPGKLKVTKRLGICVGVGDDGVHIHFSAKETAVVPSATLPPPALDSIPAELSPAGRFLLALQSQAGGQLKAKWDESLLNGIAWQWGRYAAGTLRSLADEAIAMGWPEVLEAVDLSASEKAWRCAHAAADRRDGGQLLHFLRALPEAGYLERLQLVAPVADQVLASRAEWAQLLTSSSATQWHGYEFVANLVGDDPQLAIEAVSRQLGDIGQGQRAAQWANAVSGLVGGQIVDPLVAGCPSWSALAAYRRGLAGEDLSPRMADLAPLGGAELDDLVESGAIGPSSPLDAFDTQMGDYISSRVAPDRLSVDSLSRLGHLPEIARRLLLERKFTALDSLAADDPETARFQILGQLLRGKRADLDALDEDSKSIALLAQRTRTALAGGSADILPGPILRDATLWPLFAEFAQSGTLACTPDLQAASPAFAQWVRLQRLVGLVWEGRWSEAISLGSSLSQELDEERYQDEALNLTAFAHWCNGTPETALALLERALEGDYTEALLINTGLLAAEVSPARAVECMVRLVGEAPTAELRVGALHRALESWERLENAEFPPSLLGALRDVLSGDCAFEDYIVLIDKAATIDPTFVIGLSDRGGAFRQPWLLAVARARFQSQPDFGCGDLAKEYVGAYRDGGRTPFFQKQFGVAFDVAADGLWEPLGTNVGWAQFVDIIIMNAPELISLPQRYVVTAHAGGHLAASFKERNSRLNQQAFEKFFFAPAREFLAERGRYEATMASIIAWEICRCLFEATDGFQVTARNESAAKYNPLNERMRYDSENRVYLARQLREHLQTVDLANCEFLEQCLHVIQSLYPAGDQHPQLVGLLNAAIGEYRSETSRLLANL